MSCLSPSFFYFALLVPVREEKIISCLSRTAMWVMNIKACRPYQESEYLIKYLWYTNTSAPKLWSVKKENFSMRMENKKVCRKRQSSRGGNEKREKKFHLKMCKHLHDEMKRRRFFHVSISCSSRIHRWQMMIRWNLGITTTGLYRRSYSQHSRPRAIIIIDI